MFAAFSSADKAKEPGKFFIQRWIQSKERNRQSFNILTTIECVKLFHLFIALHGMLTRA